jgi:hypothetical protein
MGKSSSGRIEPETDTISCVAGTTPEENLRIDADRYRERNLVSFMSRKSKPASDPQFTEIEFHCKIPSGAENRFIIFVLKLLAGASVLAYAIYKLKSLFW